MTYRVINSRTQQVVGTYSSKQRARKDCEYGAVVHRVVEVAK